jgi:hypothetical protein
MLTGDSISAAFGATKFGAAVQSGNYRGYGDGMICEFTLPVGSVPSAVPSDEAPRVSVEFGTYAAEKGSTNGYSMADPDTMLTTYFDREKSVDQSKGFAFLPVRVAHPGLGLVQDGNEALWAADDTVWAEIILSNVAYGGIDPGFVKLCERLSAAMSALN